MRLSPARPRLARGSVLEHARVSECEAWCGPVRRRSAPRQRFTRCSAPVAWVTSTAPRQRARPRRRHQVLPRRSRAIRTASRDSIAKRAFLLRLIIRTSARSMASRRPMAFRRWCSSSWRDQRWPIASATGPCPSQSHSTSRGKSPKPSRRRTRRGSSIAISSRRTSRSRRRASSRSSTLASQAEASPLRINRRSPPGASIRRRAVSFWLEPRQT